MNIREAIPKDDKAINFLLSEVAAVCHQDFGPNGLVDFMTPNTPEKILERIQSKDSFSLLCEIDNVIVGIITVKDYAKVDQLFVHPEYHRRGIARKLWEKAFAIIEKNTQVSEITVKSSTMGIEVYKRFGFKLAGEKNFSGDITYYPMSLVLDKGVN